MANEVSLRSAMIPVGSRIRAYFAAVDRSTGQPSVFDPAKHGCFPLDAPPIPWIDLGWVENFQRNSTSNIAEVISGYQGGVAKQFRTTVGAWVEVDFCDWGKLQMALSAGTQHMNVLAAETDAQAEPMGGVPIAAVAVLPGSSAQEIMLGPGAVDAFAAGDFIAVDVDYRQQIGFVGTGIAGSYVNNPDDVSHDLNYIRRITFNVGRVKEKTAGSLILWQPLPGGAPAALSAAQRVVAFVDREGGNFFQEWSALFIEGEESGGRVCYHYPRLRPRTDISGNSSSRGTGSRESLTPVLESLRRIALHASFLALPSADDIDHEQVACYRTYFPARCAPAY